MTTSLVTGGAGFIGSHLSLELLKANHNVIIIDDLSGGFEVNMPEKVVFKKGSITNHQFIANIFEEFKIDYVFHLAAYAAEGLSHFIKRYNYENNLIGSINLINESIKHKIKCFVFTSSIAVYGSAKPPMTEDMVPKPEDPYGIAKFCVEQELMVSKAMFDLNHIIFRPHNVYGEFQNLGDKYRNVIGIFMNQLMSGENLTIFGDGTQTRAFSYVGDAVTQIAKSIEKKEAYNQIFNIGSNQPYSVNELASLVMEAMDIAADIDYLPKRNEVQHAYSDHTKIKNIFGEQIETSLKEGLSKMTNWAKKNGIRKTKKFTDIEIYDNLPPSWDDR